MSARAALLAVGRALREALEVVEEASRSSDVPAGPEDLMDIREAAALVAVTFRGLREAARRGELPAYGRRPVRVRRKDVLEWATAKPVRVIPPKTTGDLRADVDRALGLGGEP